MSKAKTIKYGQKASALAWVRSGCIVLFVFVFGSFKATLISTVFLLLLLPPRLATVSIEEETLVFAPVLNPFWKKNKLRIDEIAKVVILPNWSFGMTEYIVHFNNGETFNESNEMLKKEVKALEVALVQIGIEVVVLKAS